MGDRAVDCARLESVCAERHRGFESPPIRHPMKSSASAAIVKVKLKVIEMKKKLFRARSRILREQFDTFRKSKDKP